MAYYIIMKIESAYHSKGEYQGRAYDNIVIVVSRPVSADVGYGNIYKTITIKPKYVEEQLDVNDLLDASYKGCDISFYYDEYQHVKSWNIS